MTALFGPAGNDKTFSEKGYKKNTDIPVFLSELGLTAYEYQCGRGVKISEASAAQLGKAAQSRNIALSLHAPYYISLSGLVEETRLKSIDYIYQSAVAAKAMGASRIIVHSGSCSKQTREQALELAKDTLTRAKKFLDENGLDDIIICPETMGKINQLGTLEEVMELCLIHDSFVPCIDFGHLNARTLGAIATKQDYEAILNTVENKLGSDRLKIFHSHFSKIEYTKAGEKKHLTFEDQTYGPNFEPLMELVCKKNLTPTFICESDSTQARDAKTMMDYYMSLL